MGKLTDTKLRALKANGKVQKIADGDGLYAYLGPKSKKKSWQMAYRFDGKQKILTLGQYPAVDLATARRKCLAAHSQLEEGLDPNAVKKEQKAATAREEQEKSLTFRVAAEQWFAKEYSLAPPAGEKEPPAAPAPQPRMRMR
ncbi:MAG: DUF4102 domain-containing protein [Desulfovibrio desulfuricans]|jgi:hypothetical protein|nr:DUF4102 domain-containing protein [Desulfovibrio desulfuricans]